MIVKTNKFDVICNTVDNGIILINKNLEVKFWNRWLEIRTGINSKEIINNSQLNLEGLTKGIYLYNLIIDGEIQSGKLIKE